MTDQPVKEASSTTSEATGSDSWIEVSLDSPAANCKPIDSCAVSEPEIAVSVDAEPTISTLDNDGSASDKHDESPASPTNNEFSETTTAADDEQGSLKRKKASDRLRLPYITEDERLLAREIRRRTQIAILKAASQRRGQAALRDEEAVPEITIMEEGSFDCTLDAQDEHDKVDMSNAGLVEENYGHIPIYVHNELFCQSPRCMALQQKCIAIHDSLHCLSHLLVLSRRYTLAHRL